MPDRSRRAAPVEVRSMDEPKPGWTLQQAVQMLAQGYRAEHVQNVTGYAARHVQAVLERTTREATQAERAARGQRSGGMEAVGGARRSGVSRLP